MMRIRRSRSDGPKGARKQQGASVVHFAVTKRALSVLWMRPPASCCRAPRRARGGWRRGLPSRPELARLRTQSSVDALSTRLKAAQKADPAKYWADEFDLGAALKSTTSGADPEADRVLQDTLAALAALAADGTPEAVLEMTRVSDDHGGILRDRGRPPPRRPWATTRPRACSSRSDEPSVRHFAASTLEAMGKRVPGDAVQTKDDGVLVDVLTAFGTLRDPNALGVVAVVPLRRPRQGPRGGARGHRRLREGCGAQAA